MNKYTLRQSMILFMTATIWGVAFVAQSVGMDYVEPYTFIAARNVIALLVLLPFAAFTDKSHRKKQNKSLLTGGICCGVCLFVASALQQFGMKYTTVGKAGFITAMYLVLVPVFGIFLKKRTGIKVWIAVVTAVAGLYLLCIIKMIGFNMKTKLLFFKKSGILYKYLQFKAYRNYEGVLVVDIINHIDSASEFSHAE